ncbi:MAG: YihY/virulence factor BrkB family protein [Hyphomonadaceae bacterium]
MNPVLLIAKFRILLTAMKALPVIRPLLRISGNLSEKNVSLVAGGVAFYAFLAIFPAIVSIIFLWEMFATDADAFALLDFLSFFMPDQAFDVVADLLIQITERDKPASGWAALITLLIALWSSSRAIDALLLAIHLIYRNTYRRGMILQRAIAMAFTLSGIIFVIIAFLMIGAVPPILHALNLGGIAELAVLTARWMVILFLFGLGAYAFYFTSSKRLKTGDTRHKNKLMPGTIWASFLWLLVSLLFSYALASLVSYQQAFGSLGAIAALLVWLWLSALTLLIGAEINNDFDGKITRARNQQGEAKTPIPAPSE